MELKKYHMQTVELKDVDGDIFKGTAYFCDKEDYEVEEDGIEIMVDGEIIIFYESDIKTIKID